MFSREDKIDDRRTMRIHIFHSNTQRNGFTVIEMIVAAGIFTSAVLIAVSLFVSVSGVQKRIASTQRIQEDMRYVTEAVAQQIRLGSIHYYYYLDPNLDGSIFVGGPGGTESIDLYPTAAENVTTLALINQSGEYIYFDHEVVGGRGILRYCQLSTEADPATCQWIDVTPTEVDITSMRFVITPSADPFYDPMANRACTTDAECLATGGPGPKPYSWESYRCDTAASRCEYFTDGGNFQPKVRIIMEAKGSVGTPKQQGHLSLETMVSTRSVEFSVLNPYHDQ